MLPPLLTGRFGRAIALGLTLLALAVLWLGAVQPLLDFYADRAEQLQQKQAIAQRMARLAAALPALQARAANATGPAPILLLDGNSDAVAGATLENLVQDMASAVGANLTSAENLPAEAAGQYRRIGLKLSLNAPLGVLMKLLQSIQAAQPPMLVDDLQIHGAPLPSLVGPQGLDAGFTVYAFRGAGDRP